MKRKCLIITLILSLVLVFSTTDMTFSATRLNAPKVTVKTVNNNYIKVSWGSVKGATKYSVYRATSSKGTYKRLITTTKRYYNDNTAKNNQKYYYKVKALGKRPTSYYSSAKYAKINFNGKIYTSSSRVVLQEGGTAIVKVTKSGSTDTLSVTSDDNVTAKLKKFDGEYYMFISLNELEGDYSYANIKFTNHKRHYNKRITVINDYTMEHTDKYIENVKPYYGCTIPDLGALTWTKPISYNYYKIDDGTQVFSMSYDVNEITHNMADNVDFIIRGYQLALDYRDFECIDSENGQYGFIDQYINRSTSDYVIFSMIQTEKQHTLQIDILI